MLINNYDIEVLLKNIPRLIYIKDIKGNYVTGTKYAEEFVKTGLDSFNNLTLLLDEITKTNQAEDEFVIKHNKSITNEREILDISGVPHCYSIYKAPVCNFHNKPIGIIVIVSNIDNSKLIETQRSTFVASLGHDLKNPTLAQIRAIELLLKGQFGELESSQKEILEMILDSCKYMSGMLCSLLTTYRTQKGVVRLNYEDFSLCDLVEECVSEMLYVAKDKNLTVKVFKNCENSVISADKVQIKRVIMNLLSNGIKYAFKQSELEITVFSDSEYLCFQFKNHSPYIPPDRQETIFARYVTFAESHKELGTGLGLYTSQRIIEAHDGEMFLKSSKDNKNTFGFKLPLVVLNPDKPKTVSF